MCLSNLFSMDRPAAQRWANLEFTSRGDRANMRACLQAHRDFDLWVVYHGDWPDYTKLVAVVSKVPCVKPFDFTKGGVREIDRLQPKLARERSGTPPVAR
jgi:hypothetical protein